METSKRHLSISVIYWITNISFWIFVAASLLAVAIAIGLFFNLFGDDLNLHVGLPVSFDLLETGKLQLQNSSIDVKFVEAYGNIGFSELPSFVGKIYGVFMLVVIGIFFYIFKIFRTFVQNVYKGEYFETSNFLLLRKAGYGVLIFWLIILIYSILQYFILAQNLAFDSLELSGSIEFHGEVVFVALFLLMLSQIFLQGAKLQEDNQLTI
ncbi:MAG: DUF2975 domain-containing protein [Bacteroidales bacterium]|nr:DUF2975 domain-containing protein [Bacteroidales bacterium]